MKVIKVDFSKRSKDLRCLNAERKKEKEATKISQKIERAIRR